MQSPPSQYSEQHDQRQEHGLQCPSEIHDVIIIGAGPCGLAVTARLCEQIPAALFTDEEHRRWHWIRQSEKRNSRNTLPARPRRSATNESLRRSSSTTSAPSSRSCSSDDLSTGSALTKAHSRGQKLQGKYSTLVLDATAPRFMSRWDRLFALYDISHLRSPMFFHIDPADRDGLLAFACETQRYGECCEIPGVVGKERSKHAAKKKRKDQRREVARSVPDVHVDERDRHDYFVPTTKLVSDHCRHTISRYGIDEARLIEPGMVKDIDFGSLSDFTDGGRVYAPEIMVETEDKERVFQIQTADSVYLSRTVVVASGPAIRLPIPLQAPEGATSLSKDFACHTSEIDHFPNSRIRRKLQRGEPTSIAIVGGGLTSAQLADLAIRRGIRKVWLLMRGDMKVKPFDVDLTWVGKWRNRAKAAFWNADSDEERFDLIKRARNGGSIPSRYVKILRKHEAAGRLRICTHTTLESISEAPGAMGALSVSTEPPIEGLSHVDYVYFATGPSGAQCGADVVPVPFLQTLQQKHPIEWLNGLPALTDELSWRPDVPLFLTGSLAALRLGPGAGNLEGARLGAERVVWGIEDHFGSGSRQDGETDDYMQGHGGKYAMLEALSLEQA